MDLIDILPPGLYEAEFVEKTSNLPHADLVSGKYLVRFEACTLNDIKALGGNDVEDDLRFEWRGAASLRQASAPCFIWL